jgi:hypothetical protein
MRAPLLALLCAVAACAPPDEGPTPAGPPSATPSPGTLTPDAVVDQVERSLKARARDPGRVDVSACTPPESTEDGLLTTCTWRSADESGAILESSGPFLFLRNGDVVHIDVD